MRVWAVLLQPRLPADVMISLGENTCLEYMIAPKPPRRTSAGSRFSKDAIATDFFN